MENNIFFKGEGVGYKFYGNYRDLIKHKFNLFYYIKNIFFLHNEAPTFYQIKILNSSTTNKN